MELEEFKVIVAGSRKLYLYDLVEHFLDRFFKKKTLTNRIVVISGKARGPDTHGETYSVARGLSDPIECPADWDNLGMAAGPIRNQEMADIADACVVFILNNSTGSADMIKRARKKGLPLIIVYVETDHEGFVVTKVSKD